MHTDEYNLLKGILAVQLYFHLYWQVRTTPPFHHNGIASQYNGYGSKFASVCGRRAVLQTRCAADISDPKYV